MKQPRYWFKINLVYGLVVVVPLAILALLIAKEAEILQTIAVSLKLESTVSAGFAMVIALVLLLLVCLGMGAIVRTRIGTWSFEKFERTILQRVPGYELLGNILMGDTRL